MIKEICAVIKIILALVAGVLGLLGLRYLTTLVHTLTSPLYVLIQILIWVALIVGAIAVWCNWYLNKKSEEDEQKYQDRQNWN
jgi:nitrate reductase gamma subunit